MISLAGSDRLAALRRSHTPEPLPDDLDRELTRLVDAARKHVPARA